MYKTSLPIEVHEILLQDAIRRDRTTARRTCLLEILWNERYLTREQLILRVEAQLGRGCFGDSAWKDTFYRDMRVVKRAFQAAGYDLIYRRNPKQPGYALRGQPPLEANLAKTLDSSVAEVDRAQIAILRSKTIAERFQMGCSISDTARRVVAYRIMKRHPQLSLAEANRLALTTRTEK
jgi:hypothetical protein